jgi:hypothetical protein
MISTSEDLAQQNDEFNTYLEEFPESDNEENAQNLKEKDEPSKNNLFEINESKQEGINNQEDNKDKSQQIENEKSDDDEDEFMEVNLTNFDNLEIDSLSKPKHLYDCLLGLRSDNKERLEQSLKYLAYLIRRNLEDLDVLSVDLINILLRINGDSDEFQDNRKNAICALIIMEPEKIAK